MSSLSIEIWRERNGINNLKRISCLASQTINTTPGFNSNDCFKLYECFKLAVKIIKNGEHFFLTASLSPSGSYLVYSDTHRLRLLHLILDRSVLPYKSSFDSKIIRIKKETLPCSLKASCQLMFTPDSRKIIAVTPIGLINVLEVTHKNILWQSNIMARKFKSCIQSGVSSLGVSHNGDWFAVSCYLGVYLFSLEKPQVFFSFRAQIPIIIVAFCPCNTKIALVSAMNRFILFEIPLTEVLKQSFVAKSRQRVVNLAGAAIGVIFEPSPTMNSFLAYSHDTMCRLSYDPDDFCSKSSILTTHNYSVSENTCLRFGLCFDHILMFETHYYYSKMSQKV
jgi:hypothetical protein